MGERARRGGPALVAAAAAAALLTLPASGASSAPTTRVSVVTGGGQANGNSIALGGAEPNAGSSAPAISADGNVVAYESDATNLVTADTNGQRDVFVYDRSSGATARASVSTDGTEGDAPSGQAALDADGSVIAFSSLDR